MITLVPWGGLCNRMRATASALILARKAEVPLRVVWYRTPDFNCAFGRIFDTAQFSCLIEERDGTHPIHRGAIKINEKWLKLTGHRVYEPLETREDQFEEARFLSEARQQPVYVRTHSPFALEPTMYNNFRPTGVPAERLRELLAQTSAAVGVHIRRTDNVKSISGSPLSAFTQLMERELERDNATKFFIASDSEEDVHELRIRFGDKIFLYPKRAYRRDDPTAIEDAVVDLFGLAHCRKLIGSYWSSFTETARTIRQIDCVIAGGNQA